MKLVSLLRSYQPAGRWKYGAHALSLVLGLPSTVVMVSRAVEHRVRVTRRSLLNLHEGFLECRRNCHGARLDLFEALKCAAVRGHSSAGEACEGFASGGLFFGRGSSRAHDSSMFAHARSSERGCFWLIKSIQFRAIEAKSETASMAALGASCGADGEKLKFHLE